jgi:hypothetical protein
VLGGDERDGRRARLAGGCFRLGHGLFRLRPSRDRAQGHDRGAERRTIRRNLRSESVASATGTDDIAGMMRRPRVMFAPVCDAAIVAAARRRRITRACSSRAGGLVVGQDLAELVARGDVVLEKTGLPPVSWTPGLWACLGPSEGWCSWPRRIPRVSHGLIASRRSPPSATNEPRVRKPQRNREEIRWRLG